MKLGLMIGTPDLRQRWCVILDGADLEGNLRQAANWGFDGVELAVREPSSLNPRDIGRWLDACGLAMIGTCTGEVFGSDGLGLVGFSRDIERAAMARLRQIIDFSAHFGPGTLVNIGRVRGRLGAKNPQESWNQAVRSFQELAEYARPFEVRIVLEPINHYEVNFILTTQDGIAFAEDVNRTNFGLMLDTYHMNIEDQDILESLREAHRYLWHVHISDNNRRWPGNGHIDFASIVATLGRLNYSGYLSAEVNPWPDSKTAGTETVRFMKSLLVRARV